jgi:serine/threonine-protein kinase
MNLVLEPKGVVAKATLKDSCLQIFFASEQLLSQQTIVNFVKTGLLNLEANSIQKVKVFAQKEGQDSPVWSDEFQVATVLSAMGQASMGMPKMVTPKSAAPEVTPKMATPKVAVPNLTAWKANVSQAVAPKSSDPKSVVPKSATSKSMAPKSVAPKNMVPTSVSPKSAAPRLSLLEPDLPALTPLNLSSEAQSFNQVSLKPVGQPELAHSSPPRRNMRRPRRAKRNLGFYLRKLAYRVRASNKHGLVLAIAIGAFMVGGSIALINHFQAKDTRQTAYYGLSPDGSFNNQMLIQAGGNRSINGQEADAKVYLAQMNRAQQSFYQSNSRFAANLEELERSASLVSRSSDYIYKLVVRDETQSVLTAVPKTENLRSYTAAVLSAQSPQSAGAITTILCETTSPSTFPPVLPQTSNEMVQCPADSVQVVN